MGNCTDCNGKGYVMDEDRKYSCACIQWLSDKPHTPSLAEIEAKAGEHRNCSMEHLPGEDGIWYRITHLDGWQFAWLEAEWSDTADANRRRAWTLLTMGGDE